MVKCSKGTRDRIQHPGSACWKPEWIHNLHPEIGVNNCHWFESFPYDIFVYPPSPSKLQNLEKDFQMNSLRKLNTFVWMSFSCFYAFKKVTRGSHSVHIYVQCIASLSSLTKRWCLLLAFIKEHILECINGRVTEIFYILGSPGRSPSKVKVIEKDLSVQAIHRLNASVSRALSSSDTGNV